MMTVGDYSRPGGTSCGDSEGCHPGRLQNSLICSIHTRHQPAARCHKIEHLFCATCGAEAFAYGASPDGSPVRAVNVRCVPSIDLDSLTVQSFDGASR